MVKTDAPLFTCADLASLHTDSFLCTCELYIASILLPRMYADMPLTPSACAVKNVGCHSDICLQNIVRLFCMLRILSRIHNVVSAHTIPGAAPYRLTVASNLVHLAWSLSHDLLCWKPDATL